MTDYPGADKRQWFADTYPGDHMTPNVVVLHTTEGSTWPGYNGGSEAPTLTIRPNLNTKRLDVRQHFPLEMSSRALVNLAGGVETNTMNAIQIELVGTCAKGGPGMHWPTAPDWAVKDLGEVLADLHGLFPAIPLTAAPLWLPYPESYGPSKARMTNRQWTNFYGICGHQHVPENEHGDPGDLPIAAILDASGAHAGTAERKTRKRPAKKAAPKKPADPQPAKADAKTLTRPERADAKAAGAEHQLEEVKGPHRRKVVAPLLDLLRRFRHRLHRTFPRTRRHR